MVVNDRVSCQINPRKCRNPCHYKPTPDFHPKTDGKFTLDDKWMPVLLKLAQEKQITSLMARNSEDICATDLLYLQINYCSLELGKLQERVGLDQSYWHIRVKTDKELWLAQKSYHHSWKGPPEMTWLYPSWETKPKWELKQRAFRKNTI